MSHAGTNSILLSLRTFNGSYGAEQEVDMKCTFRFLNNPLNKQLISLLKKAKVKHSLDQNDVIHYQPDDEEMIENEFISSVRSKTFSSWQLLSCPQEWVEIYKSYMNRHKIKFAEELIDGRVNFLIPRSVRPHSWKLTPPKAMALAKRTA
jgi:hypothetical protein